MVAAGSVLSAAQHALANSKRPWGVRRDAMLAFERLLLAFCEQNAVAEAELTTVLAPHFAELNRLYEAFETELEVNFAHSILEGKERLSDYTLFDRFERLICAEGELCSLQSGDRVMMIGSGPLPLTAILLASRFNVNVIGIERDYHSAAISQRVIRQLGLETQISILHSDGASSSLHEATCVLVAVLARPKHRILESILKNRGVCRKVICRTSYGARQALYGPTPPGALLKYAVTQSNIARRDQTISSLILEVPHSSR